MPRGNQNLAIAMGVRITERRKELGFTQEYAAEKAGITYQQYNKAERGKACVSSDTLHRISAALDISADYLLNGTEWTHKYADVDALLDKMTSRQRFFASKMLRDWFDFCQSEIEEK